MGEAGHSYQVRELVRFDVVQHASCEGGTELRNGVGAVLEAVVLRIHDFEGFDAVEDGQHRTVCQVNLQRVDAGHVLQLADHGRHVVAQDIQLQQVLVDFVIVEVGGDDVRVHVVGRVLYRTKLVNLVVIGHDDDAARMLAGGSLHPGAVLGQPVRFEFIDRPLPFFEKFHYVAVGGLVCHRTYGTSLEYILFAEDGAYILVGYRLVFPGEVQVDIGFLVPVETQEGCERNGEAVTDQRCAAVRAVLFRHVDTAVVKVHVPPLQVVAVRTHIMGFQRIYFGDPRHGGRKRRSYGASGAYQVAVGVGLVHQHLGGHVHHGVPVVDDG